MSNCKKPDLHDGPCEYPTMADELARLRAENSSLKDSLDLAEWNRSQAVKQWQAAEAKVAALTKERDEQEGRIDRICETASQDRLALNRERIENAALAAKVAEMDRALRIAKGAIDPSRVTTHAAIDTALSRLTAPEKKPCGSKIEGDDCDPFGYCTVHRAGCPPSPGKGE